MRCENPRANRVQAAWVSAADGEYHNEEKAKIRKMASILGVTEDVVEQLEKLYKEESTIQQKRFNLLYPQKSPY